MTSGWFYVGLANDASLFFLKIFRDISPRKILSKLDFNSSKNFKILLITKINFTQDLPHSPMLLSLLNIEAETEFKSSLFIWNPLLLFTVIIYSHNAAYICLFGYSEWYITFLLEDFSRFFVLEDFVEVGFQSFEKLKFFFICKNYPLFPLVYFNTVLMIRVPHNCFAINYFTMTLFFICYIWYVLYKVIRTNYKILSESFWILIQCWGFSTIGNTVLSYQLIPVYSSMQKRVRPDLYFEPDRNLGPDQDRTRTGTI